MPNPPPMSMGCLYHIYNRGNAGEDIFREPRNYRYFLDKYAAAVWPVADTYAYCLLRNHFHLLIRTLMPDEQRGRAGPAAEGPMWRPQSPGRAFGTFFGAYAQGYNKTYRRTGSLFEHPYRRVVVVSEAHLYRLVVYIHRNPEHHGFVDDFCDWRHASYSTLLSNEPTRLCREDVLAWFGSLDAFIELHQTGDDDGIGYLISE